MAENSNKKTCVNKLNQKINFQYPQKNLKNLKCLPCIIFPFRSSQQKCSVKKGVFRNFAKFTGKHLCQSLFAEPQPATLLKKRLWHWCFSVNFAKFLRTPFLIEHLWWLLLLIAISISQFMMSICVSSSYIGKS